MEETCKFPRVGNARNDSKKIGSRGSEQIFPEGEEIAELRRRGGGCDVTTNRFHSWHHHSSRIIRVSRASGGKDRHSKVMTSKGLRDRRVRLSVTTAIQFYDLQDRLGYDQPSKAVEWLIKAAGDAISELPSLNNTFPDDNASKQASDERRGSVGTEQGIGTAGDAEDHHDQTQSQNLSWSNKSAGSSTSDQTSKGSGLSLSRSEIRVKARERARERTAKEKEEKEKENNNADHQNKNNPISQTASFTELLTDGITSTTAATATSPTGDELNLFNKGARPQQLWCATPMDYFNSSHNNNNQSSGLSSGQVQYPQGVCVSPLLNVMGENQSDHLQHFSFIPDNIIPAVVSSCSQQPSGSDYNLNFTISSNSGLAGFNRGTLQSNSPSLMTHPLHRFSSPFDASNLPFFIGAAAAPTMEINHHHHQFSAGFDGRLQLSYGDASRHSDHKAKPKN